MLYAYTRLVIYTYVLMCVRMYKKGRSTRRFKPVRGTEPVAVYYVYGIYIGMHVIMRIVIYSVCIYSIIISIYLISCIYVVMLMMSN